MEIEFNGVENVEDRFLSHEWYLHFQFKVNLGQAVIGFEWRIIAAAIYHIQMNYVLLLYEVCSPIRLDLESFNRDCIFLKYISNQPFLIWYVIQKLETQATKYFRRD